MRSGLRPLPARGGGGGRAGRCWQAAVRVMESFRLPTAGSVGGGPSIEVLIPTSAAAASSEGGIGISIGISADGTGGEPAPLITEASQGGGSPLPLGRAMAALTADVSATSGDFAAALGHCYRHLDAQPAPTVAALAPVLLEQAVKGASARLRKNAMGTFANLLPRSEATTRLFVAQFGRELAPADADKSAVLAVALVAVAAMQRLEKAAAAPGAAGSVAPELAVPAPAPARSALIQEVGAPEPLVPAVAGSGPPSAVGWAQVGAWVALHEALAGRLFAAAWAGDGGGGESGILPTRLNTAMADAVLEICRLCCQVVAAGGAPEQAQQQWKAVCGGTGAVLVDATSRWLSPPDAAELPTTTWGPCPTISDLLSALAAPDRGWVAQQWADWLPWLRWDCPALGSTRRLEAALEGTDAVSTALLLLRAPVSRRSRALASDAVRAKLLSFLLDSSSLSDCSPDAAWIVRAILTGALLEPCRATEAETLAETALDGLVGKLEEWVIVAPSMDAAKPALPIARELLVCHAGPMVERITSWLNVDEASAIGSVAQELLGETARAALGDSSKRLRRWAVQLVGYVASGSGAENHGGQPGEVLTKLASGLAVPLLRAVSAAGQGHSAENVEIAQVLHQFPATVVVPALLDQQDLTAAQRCARVTQFVRAVAAAYHAGGTKQSDEAFTEVVVECVAIVFDYARDLTQAATPGSPGSPKRSGMSPPGSPTRMMSPGQIGQPEASGGESASAQEQEDTKARKEELTEMLTSKLHSWLVILCDDGDVSSPEEAARKAQTLRVERLGSGSTVREVGDRSSTRWVRVVQLALEKAFALASDGTSLRLLGAVIGGNLQNPGESVLSVDAQAAILDRCAAQMRGQPALTLELLQEDDRQQAKAAEPIVGSKYKVLLRGTVRETVDTASAKLRALMLGDVVTVAEHAVHEATGQMRILLQERGGWTSLVAQDGRPILSPIDPPPQTPSLIQSLLFERLRPLLVLRMMPPDIIDQEDQAVVELLGERISQPLEYDQVRKLAAEVFGQMVSLPLVLRSCTFGLGCMLGLNGVIEGDDVLGAKAWIYSTCTAVGLSRSFYTSEETLRRHNLDVAHAVDCWLRVLQTGAPVPTPGTEDLNEEEKLSRGTTDCIAALLCALCIPTAGEIAPAGVSLLKFLTNRLSKPAAGAALTWAEQTVPVLQVFKTVGLMLSPQSSQRAAQDPPQQPPRDPGAESVLRHVVGPIVELAVQGSPALFSEIEEISECEPECEKDEDGDQLVVLRPAALQLVFSIVLQLKSEVFAGELRAQIFDACEAACCAADDLSRMRGAQLAGAIITCHAGETRGDGADDRMVGLVVVLQRLAADDPCEDVARAALQLVSLGLAD